MSTAGEEGVGVLVLEPEPARETRILGTRPDVEALGSDRADAAG